MSPSSSEHLAETARDAPFAHRRREPENLQVEAGETARFRDSIEIPRAAAARWYFVSAGARGRVDESKNTNSLPTGGHPMSFARVATDPVEELRLRRWARENYVEIARRDQTWHAVVLDEMNRKDQELAVVESYAEVARRIVPIAPDHGRLLRGPHVEPVRSPVLARVPCVE
jgi:hypothetical protein